MENQQPGGASGSQTNTPHAVRVKEENVGDSTARHLHKFRVKFNTGATETYNICCDRPRTVLEAIKSSKQCNLKCSDEDIIIQLGEADKENIVATHFPCSRVRDDEILIICQSKKVEKAQDQHGKPIHSRENYSVFYIDTVGGQNTKSKELFRNKAVKQFKFLCVYGEKGMTVEEALKRDGRFIDDLGDFTLSDNKKPDDHTDATQVIDFLDTKKYKLCLARKKKTQANQKASGVEQQGGSSISGVGQQGGSSVGGVGQQGGSSVGGVGQQGGSSVGGVGQQGGSSVGGVGQQGGSSVGGVGQQGGSSVGGVGQQGGSSVGGVGQQGGRSVNGFGQQSGSSVRAAGQQGGSSVKVKEINDRARHQFPQYIEWMESHFPGDSYQKALDLRREDFGKIQSSFSEVHTMRNLIKLSESVCLLEIDFPFTNTKGTGFVLFDNLILTNYHLFKECTEFLQHTKVTAVFNYEHPESICDSFNVKGVVVSNSDKLDYAVLEFDCEDQNKKKPGLLNKFGPVPLKGESCIIGHPAGGVKKMDPTCIIEKENRVQAVNSNLADYKDYLFTLHAINQSIKTDPLADVLVTYNTFMYHGSSGSPVFAAQGRVFGLHSGGFFWGCPKPEESVIEFAFPLLLIFKDFVGKLRERKDEEMLMRVKKAAKGNPYLENILEHEFELRGDRREIRFGRVEKVKFEPAYSHS